MYSLPIEFIAIYYIDNLLIFYVRIPVLFLIVGLYFIIACFAAWLILFVSGREMFLGCLLATGRWISRKFSSLENRLTLKWVNVGLSIRVSAGVATKTIKQHCWVLLAGAAIISTPPLIALSLGSKARLDGFDTPLRETNMLVAELLEGEQLVPPASLPPAIFTAQEVSLVRPQLASASRNWAKLNPDFEQILLQIFKIMKEDYGYEMAILEGYRSPERQNMLAKLGSHVTNASAFQSYHQFGLAADCAFLRNGKLVISEKDPWAMRGYQLYGQVAESVSLRWGGRWKMMDFGHVELHMPNVLKG